MPKDYLNYSHRIVAHGYRGVVEIPPEGSGNLKTGRSAAKLFARDVPTHVKNIDFVSCYGAYGGPFSNAQMLANKTRKVVFSSKTSVLQGISHNDVFRHTVQRIEPQSRLVSYFTGAVNHRFGKLSRMYCRFHR